MWIGDKETIFRFRPRDNTPEEVERARLAAVERRRELEAEHREVVVRNDEHLDGMEKKDSGVRGIWWNKFGRFWSAEVNNVEGKRFQQQFRPTDFTAEAIEVARLLAVQWRGDLLRRKAVAADP
mmetsp:Transcript_61576/g.190750  ORF Transcript_61576/g.190750 Transcript_61576/m.190750 type:complete len:124 (+) Transcript_61576:3-374(+)